MPLTGKTRFRVGFLKKLILQHQVLDTNDIFPYWIDSKPEFLLEFAPDKNPHIKQ